MKKCLILICLFLCLQLVHAQKNNLIEKTNHSLYDNIKVEKLSSDQHSTSFLILIKQSVPAHFHKSHTENIYVIEGEAKMLLGEDTLFIKPGDHIVIPEGTVHSVLVNSDVPLKVLSIQSPEFLGEDRFFVK